MRGLKYRFHSDLNRQRHCRIAHAVRGLKYNPEQLYRTFYGRIAHAVRGLKLLSDLPFTLYTCRIAHAVRGLKWRLVGLRLCCITASHRSRGAWIEMGFTEIQQDQSPRRIAHAVRGLKF